MAKLIRPTDIPPIPESTKQFLELFPGKHLFFTLPDARHMLGTIEELWPRIHNKDAFLTVNEHESNKRGLDLVTNYRAIWVDDDVPRPKPRKFPIQPNVIVESSKGKWHYYWLTHTTNKDEWNRVMLQMVQNHGCDKGAKDASRVLRLPGTLNRKYDPPMECRLHFAHGGVYDWDAITTVFKPLDVIPFSTDENAESAQGPSFDFRDSKKQFLTCEFVTAPINGYIMHLAHHGYNKTQIHAHIEDWYADIPNDVRAVPENAARYVAAYRQTDKWINSAILTADKRNFKDVVPVTPNIDIEPLEGSISKIQLPLPLQCIPPTLLQAANEVGDWAGIGPDPAILSGVFVTSALLNKNVIIHEIGESLTTHAQCGVLIAMDTGGRKSAIYEQMNKPFFDYEDRLQEDWNKNKHTNKTQINMLDSHIKKLRKDELKYGIDDPGFLELAQQIGAIEEMKEKLDVKKPFLHASDVTEEKLIRKLHDNNDTIAVISDDARQVVNNLTGNYKQQGQTGESVYVNALTGSSIMYERVSSDPIYIKKPVLNAFLFVQPDAALKLRDSEMYVPSGLAARMPIYLYPTSGSDIIESTKRRMLMYHKLEPYYEALKSLCTRRVDNPLHINLDERAMDRCRGMDKELVQLLRGPWINAYDKINKIVTTTLIYATCFAAIQDPEFAIAIQDTNKTQYNLPVVYINQAFEFAKALFGQALHTYETLQNESTPRYAQMLLTRLKKDYAAGKIREGFTVTSYFERLFSDSWRPNVRHAVDYLLLKGWLFTTNWSGAKRKLNGGYPEGIVHPNDTVYHLNLKGIKKYEDERQSVTKLEN